ncbi:DUF1684 domain-containing protein [Patiriisocius sp. Uisw_017]|jgi:uncharacterized protein (DUF1684 family)|uniref:DUF1684 domain-containing protein n=1 Tax=Patiriisocius sp. Uisw_017 TaxID=3230968 RepID=UPI0039ED8898
MIKLLFLLVGIYSISINAQRDSPEYIEAAEYQASENEKFSTVETTILTKKDFKKFKALDFYPINLKCRVEAKFVRTPNEPPFKMTTTTDRLVDKIKYGKLHFEIDGKKLQLNLYQSVPPMEDPEYIDYLFLPFTDLSGGEGSYAGGRFLDARIPKGATMIIDFNKAYNPYCAYNSRYSCEIPPLENHLEVRIEAGVKDFGKH